MFCWGKQFDTTYLSNLAFFAWKKVLYDLLATNKTFLVVFDYVALHIWIKAIWYKWEVDTQLAKLQLQGQLYSDIWSYGLPGDFTNKET